MPGSGLMLMGVALICIAHGTVGAQGTRKMKRLVDKDLELATSQYRLLAANTPPDVMPRNYDPVTGKLVTSNTSWWTSGFFPGSLLLIYEGTGDTATLSEAKRRLSILEKEKFHTKDHDLGFMIYNSFGNAWRLTREPAYRAVVLTAAETLTGRYRPSIRSMQSWDSSANFKCPVIIDNMMNLELLCWAADEIREPKYKVIAIDHAETTLKNHYRPDHSSFHVVDYNLATGGVLSKRTAQGYSDSSAWSRGQAWGLYGFNIMYRYTHEPTYLQQARDIAGFILHHPNMPADKILYWDLNAPDIPKAKRDVSASCIMASALLELSRYTQGDEQKEYLAVAKKIIVNLSKKPYLSGAGESMGFLLKHSVGAIPYNSEVDVSLTYADYYFLEAFLRYRAVVLNNDE